ncbi:response regulator [Shewanella sp. A3A]|nr:response regulator [Shewanella ferrihydritica]
MALDELKILLVEDDPVFRTIVASFLRGRGALVTEAGDGEVALAAFFAESFDVVLSDITMPNMDGLALLTELANAGSYVPAIVMSGNQQMSNVTDALKLGAADYLVKPISDLYQIEHAIYESLRGTHLNKNDIARDVDDLSYLELNEHLSLLEHNANAAKSVQQQLFPNSSVSYKQATFEYTLFSGHDVSPYFIDSERLANGHLSMYLAHFYPEDHRAAFGSVLLRSFMHQSSRELLKNNGGQLEPCKMLEYLNLRLMQANMGIYADILLIVYVPETRIVHIAQAGTGLRCYIRQQDDFTPVMLPPAIQLGLVEWGACQGHTRVLQTNEQLCVVSSNQYRSLVSKNQFAGVDFQAEVPAGGYFQLSAD